MIMSRIFKENIDTRFCLGETVLWMKKIEQIIHAIGILVVHGPHLLWLECMVI